MKEYIITLIGTQIIRHEDNKPIRQQVKMQLGTGSKADAETIVKTFYEQDYTYTDKIGMIEEKEVFQDALSLHEETRK